jgi:hypothetical protein
MNTRRLPGYLNVDWPEHAAIPTLDEWKAALREDRVVNLAIARAREGPSLMMMPTQDSISEGERILRMARARSCALMRSRIKSGDFLTASEIKERLGITRFGLKVATELGALFAVIGPRGRAYYPAFFCDKEIGRQVLEPVTLELAGLPGSSQYHFFTNRQCWLGGMTPLEALKAGRVEEVKRAAVAYVAS